MIVQVESEEQNWLTKITFPWLRANTDLESKERKITCRRGS